MESVSENCRRLVAARDHARLTQDQLGKRLTPPMSKQQIYKLEHRQSKIKPKLAAQLAVILGGVADDYTDPEFLAAGVRDRGREWTGQEIAVAAEARPMTVTSTQFADVFVTLVRSIGGDAAAAAAGKKNYSKLSASLFAMLAEENDPDAISNHLTQYLLTAAAAASAVGLDDLQYDFRRWRNAAEAAAALLIALAASPDAPRKSG